MWAWNWSHLWNTFNFRKLWLTLTWWLITLFGNDLRNVLLVNSNADHLKVGDFGLSKLIRVQHAHDVYKLTGETGSCEWFVLLCLMGYYIYDYTLFLIIWLNEKQTVIWLQKYLSTGNMTKRLMFSPSEWYCMRWGSLTWCLNGSYCIQFSCSCLLILLFPQMIEGEPPLASYEPYEAARYVAEGHRPTIRSKSFVPDLRE